MILNVVTWGRANNNKKLDKFHSPIDGAKKIRRQIYYGTKAVILEFKIGDFELATQTCLFTKRKFVDASFKKHLAMCKRAAISINCR